MGAYSISTNQYWWFFQYAPASWDGVRMVGNHNVVQLWKVPGRADEVWQAANSSTEVGRVLVFTPTAWKERVHVGWHGWHPKDFNFTAGPGGMEFQRGIFAEHEGGCGPWCFNKGLLARPVWEQEHDESAMPWMWQTHT